MQENKYHVVRTRLLPSEKRAAVKAARELANEEFSRNNGSGIVFQESCVYDSELVTIVRDDGQFFFREDTTGGVGCPSEWEELSEKKAASLIERLATDGYEFSPY